MLAFAKLLLTAESTAVYHLGGLPGSHPAPISGTGANLTSCMVRSLEGAPDPTGLRGHFLLGEFKLEDGRSAILIQNQDAARTQWATVTFAPELNTPKNASGVLEVDPVHATLAPLLDDSPLHPGLQIGLKPGMARFLVAAPGQAAAKTDDDNSASAAAVPRWKQDVFAISEWQPPFVGAGPNWEHEADVRYQEFANANFTVLLGGLNRNETTCYCSTGKELCCGKTGVAVQMKLCEKHGLKCVPGPKEGGGLIQRIDPAATSSKAWWGFDMSDEPNVKEFPMLRNVSDQVAALYPGHLRFINLLPNYATPAQYNASTYSDYVDAFVSQVDPDVISMDHYPFFELADDQSCESRAGYRANLGVLRKAALKANIPFWNFFSTMPFGGHSDPTEAQLAWQIFTSLAYGAKGILYFCYWSPAGQGGTFIRGGGVMYPQGTLNKSAGPPGDISLHSAKLYRRGAHYEHARKINSIVKNWGRYLLGATSTGIYRIFPGTAAPKPSSCKSGDQPPSSLDGCVLNNVTDLKVSASEWTPKLGEGILIGQFTLDDGRTALLLHNQNPDFNIWPTIGFVDSVKLADVLEVDPVTGAETALLDDSPLMEGWQISIQAGYARFLIVPTKSEPAGRHLVLKSDDSAAENVLSLAASNYTNQQIYHSSQTPGYTAWCALWSMPGNSTDAAEVIMTNFVEAKGPSPTNATFSFPVLVTTNGADWAPPTTPAPLGYSRGIAVMAGGRTMVRPALNFGSDAIEFGPPGCEKHLNKDGSIGYCHTQCEYNNIVSLLPLSESRLRLTQRYCPQMRTAISPESKSVMTLARLGAGLPILSRSRITSTV